jgi:hypothetical protein
MRRRVNWYRVAGLALMVAPWVLVALVVKACNP